MWVFLLVNFLSFDPFFSICSLIYIHVSIILKTGVKCLTDFGGWRVLGVKVYAKYRGVKCLCGEVSCYRDNTPSYLIYFLPRGIQRNEVFREEQKIPCHLTNQSIRYQSTVKFIYLWLQSRSKTNGNALYFFSKLSYNFLNDQAMWLTRDIHKWVGLQFTI